MNMHNYRPTQLEISAIYICRNEVNRAITGKLKDVDNSS